MRSFTVKYCINNNDIVTYGERVVESDFLFRAKRDLLRKLIGEVIDSLDGNTDVYEITEKENYAMIEYEVLDTAERKYLLIWMK